jgi:hypothetical protein
MDIAGEIEHQFEKSKPLLPNGTCPVGYKKRKAYIIQKTAKIVPARCVKADEETASLRPATNTMKCPPGQIYRRPYLRKYSNTVKREGYLVKRKGVTVRIRPKMNAVQVKGSCVSADEAEAGATLEQKEVKKGELLKYGYTFRLPMSMRHEALKRAIYAYGARHVYRKLYTVAKLFKISKPDAARIFAADRDWVKRNFRINE